MGFYDIMDEIAQKNVIKTETGDNRIFGVLVGIVVNNYDEKMPGRVCVRIPVRDKDYNDLQWARVAFSSGGNKWGSYFIPEVGDEVLVVFEQGLIDRPYIIACVNKDNDKFITSNTEETNQIKAITTRYGSTIRFDDVKSDDGENPDSNKDKISIYTCKNKHQIIIDNENNSVLISDKKGDNSIKMTTAENEGNITIKCTDKMTIKVGDGTTLTMDKEGNVKLQCKQVNVTADDSIKLESNQGATIKSGNITVNASSVMKLESSGPITASGSPVKFG